MPKVSVFTPLYNTDSEQLYTTIDSILNQTLTDFEFVIHNWPTDQRDNPTSAFDVCRTLQGLHDHPDICV